MKRRALIASAGAVAVSGCLGILGSGNVEKMNDRVESAVSELQKGKKAMGEEVSNFQSQEIGIEFEEQRITVHLDAAKEDLAAAKDVAPEDRRESIDSLATLVGAYRDATNGLVKIEEALATLAELNESGSTENFEAASGLVGDAQETVSAAQERFTTASAKLENLDPTSLSEGLPLETKTARTLLEDLRALAGESDVVLDGIGAVLDAVGSVVDGAKKLQTANDLIDKNKYGTALQRVDTALGHFKNARSSYQSAVSNEAFKKYIGPGLQNLECLLDALVDGTTRLKEGIRALRNGEQDTAQAKLQKAREAFNRCTQGSGALRPPLDAVPSLGTAPGA